MPISSGATGRVGVGVNPTITWTPDGWKQDTNSLNRNCDSYLERYLETHPDVRRKSDIDTTAGPHNRMSKLGPKGKMNGITKDINGDRNEIKDGDHKGNLSGESSSKKSSTCAIL